jgi:hypothetical protein
MEGAKDTSVGKARASAGAAETVGPLEPGARQVPPGPRAESTSAYSYRAVARLSERRRSVRGTDPWAN